MVVEDAKKAVKLFSVFMIIGLVIFIIGVSLSIKFIFFYPANRVKTEATITAITGNSTAVIYEANGRIYNKSYSVYSSTYYVGKKVKVLYNKSHPNKSIISRLNS